MDGVNGLILQLAETDSKLEDLRATERQAQRDQVTLMNRRSELIKKIREALPPVVVKEMRNHG